MPKRLTIHPRQDGQDGHACRARACQASHGHLANGIVHFVQTPCTAVGCNCPIKEHNRRLFQVKTSEKFRSSGQRSRGFGSPRKAVRLKWEDSALPASSSASPFSGCSSIRGPLTTYGSSCETVSLPETFGKSPKHKANIPIKNACLTDIRGNPPLRGMLFMFEKCSDSGPISK